MAQVTVVSLFASAITVYVYSYSSVGRGLLIFTPFLVKILSIVTTAVMFWL
jgi:predicted DNA repair protein MutK